MYSQETRARLDQWSQARLDQWSQARTPDTTYHLPLTTTYHLPLTTYHLVLTSYYLLLTNCYLLLTTLRLPLTLPLPLPLQPTTTTTTTTTATSALRCRAVPCRAVPCRCRVEVVVVVAVVVVDLVKCLRSGVSSGYSDITYCCSNSRTLNSIHHSSACIHPRPFQGKAQRSFGRVPCQVAPRGRAPLVRPRARRPDPPVGRPAAGNSHRCWAHHTAASNGVMPASRRACCDKVEERASPKKGD